jgi:osmoprotectant transport system substrate-binding protein
VSSTDGPVSIGASTFTESQILAELYAGVLRKAGVYVSITQPTNREVLEAAIQAGDVQVVPDHLGTLTAFLQAKVNGTDAVSVASNNTERTLAAAQDLANPLGITLLDPSAAEHVNALSFAGDFARKYDLRPGGPPECPKRPFCRPGLESAYGMRVAEFVPWMPAAR